MEIHKVSKPTLWSKWPYPRTPHRMRTITNFEISKFLVVLRILWGVRGYDMILIEFWKWVHTLWPMRKSLHTNLSALRAGAANAADPCSNLVAVSFFTKNLMGSILCHFESRVHISFHCMVSFLIVCFKFKFSRSINFNQLSTFLPERIWFWFKFKFSRSINFNQLSTFLPKPICFRFNLST